ncbi:hypothetical protein HPO96_27955 [Kribbella sandramycini]|uniref:Uncharacterized protein n=1 Tax=Kribbella sandramycini TaxID=60450 RepID=A0A7Y4P1B8_9ACTN|nr:hypothetical protein [Kribbella sandramycini]MBB6571436.1 hypothetical protein [Kribbella sandramycini]NOL44087.1 hypothetical protein [Kribbella sandramycini]
MAGTIWIPGAERLKPSAPGGTITSNAPPRVVWHTTEADPGTSSVWAAMIRVLTNKSAEPQILYDPLTDRLGQFLPLNVGGRALRNDGSTMTNRVGKVCIQVEVIGRAAKPFTGYWKPGKNFRAMMTAIRSWGIKDSWPAGPPPRFVASPPHNVPESPRSRTIWLNRGGHYGHSHIPGNDHGDPGAISVTALFAASGAPPKELFTVGQYENLMQQIKNEGAATRQEVRRQAIWALRYGVQTEDERAQANRAFDDAIDAGKSLKEALAAAARVLQPIADDLERAARKNG